MLDLSPELQKAPLDQFIPLDDYPEIAPLNTTLLAGITPPLDPVTPAKILQLTRQRALGKECSQVSASLGIDGALLLMITHMDPFHVHRNGATGCSP